MAVSKQTPATIVYWDYCAMPLRKNANIPRIFTMIKSRIWHKTKAKSSLEINLYIPSLSTEHGLPHPVLPAIHESTNIQIHQTMSNHVRGVISRDIRKNENKDKNDKNDKNDESRDRAIALIHPVAKSKRWESSIKSNLSISCVFLVVFGGIKENQSPAPSFIDEIIHIDCGCRPEEIEKWRKYKGDFVKSVHSAKGKKTEEKKGGDSKSLNPSKISQTAKDDSNTQHVDNPTHSTNGYNYETGGLFFEREIRAKHEVMESNLHLSAIELWLDRDVLRTDGEFSLFFLSETSIYEEIFAYLDGRSIVYGLMTTCKKMHYLRFLDAECLRLIWKRLLHRDFPRLHRRSATVHIPYLDPCRRGQFRDTVLSKRVERGIYFSKITRDPFWRIVFNVHDVVRRRNEMDDKEMEDILSGITWKDVLRGKEVDGEYTAYKRLVALRHHPYIKAFANGRRGKGGMDNLPLDLPTNETINRFCIALSKHIVSGWTVLYFNPWITSTHRVPWKCSDLPASWHREYGSCCYAVNEGDRKDAQLPDIVEMIGTVFVNVSKASSVVNQNWLPFLQTFDHSIVDHLAVHNGYGWFYHQFMVNAMVDRLRNLRTLIQIVQ